MENASKALLIAGGVLIAMVIASFGVYLYGVFHSHSENLLAAMSEKEVNEFNAKFQAFENRELTANEIISIVNLVRENNTNSENQISINWNINSDIFDVFNYRLDVGRFNNSYISNEELQRKNSLFIKDFSMNIDSNYDGKYVIEKNMGIGGIKTIVYNFYMKVEEYNQNIGKIEKIQIYTKIY